MNREHELAALTVGALLREDYAGLAGRVRHTAGGPVLDLPAQGRVLPLEADGFLADLRIAGSAPPLTLADVEALVGAISDPRDAAGVAAFGAECRQALASLRVRDRHLDAARAVSLAAPGLAGAIGYDALAAAMTHPAYPTSACRLGFTDDDHLRYAPEYLPEFELNWVAVPRSVLTRGGGGPPPWWPAPEDVGLPASLAATHDLLPVHPLTARRVLPQALAEAGLAFHEVAPGTALRVRPTLSVRTVAVTGQPRAHLKLPLPVSTLGLRNRRAIAPATLADGALVHRVLATVLSKDTVLSEDTVLSKDTGLARDAGLGGLMITDDGTYAHAGHPFLGYLLRLPPAGLDRCHVVPVAGLLAPAGPDGRLVIDQLASASAPDLAVPDRAWPPVPRPARPAVPCSIWRAPTSACCSGSRCGCSSGMASRSNRISRTPR
ncbi:MAG TPA: IucA/IucC family protein [Streptosporangiaceae bacterium]|nr:IucA/IucC family protein [Streptosporangiaceae bacterium]